MSKLIIDIGGTKLRSELKSKKEECLTKDIELVEFLESILKKDKSIDTVSISFAGQVHNGVILSSPNIKVKEKNIKEYFEKRYKITLKIDNDLNCALLAEKKSLEEKNMALLFVGSGVGASVFENGHIVRGEKNIACEIGHIPFKKAPFRCGCGRDNCIEIFGGGVGLQNWLKYYGYPWMNLEEIKNAKDKNLQNIYKNFLEALLRAAGTLVTLFNPKVLVLGGGVIEANPYILDIISQDIKKYALKQSCENLQIFLSKLENASLQGAKEL